jgi:hypothetical protein
MRFSLALVFSFMVLLAPMAEAAVYKGQKTYVKKCRKCHGGGQKMAASKRMREWKKILNRKNKGIKLANIHLESEKAKKSWKYFDSKRYRKRARHLKDFMVEYAKDSGNVPACN